MPSVIVQKNSLTDILQRLAPRTLSSLSAGVTSVSSARRSSCAQGHTNGRSIDSNESRTFLGSPGEEGFGEDAEGSDGEVKLVAVDRTGAEVSRLSARGMCVEGPQEDGQEA